MTHAQEEERQILFDQLDENEAAAEKLANRIRDKGPEGFETVVDPLLFTENPLLISMMGRVWGEAIRKSPGIFENSSFSGISPEVASAAWQLAACEYGQDCGSNNDVVLYGCLYKVACSADSLREYYQKYALSPDKFDQLLVTTGKIINALKQKNSSSLHG